MFMFEDGFCVTDTENKLGLEFVMHSVIVFCTYELVNSVGEGGGTSCSKCDMGFYVCVLIVILAHFECLSCVFLVHVILLVSC